MATLAIDQSTTSTSALVFDNSGNNKIVKQIEHQQFHPYPGWVEHDGNELIQNIQHCIDCCDGISAIGIDNQGESCMAWDADSKQPISPVIVWQDNRTHQIIDQLKVEKQQSFVFSKAGLPLDTYFSATKLAWIIKHVPEANELLQQGKLRLGTTDAFFLDRLTGHFVTDISTASRTSLMNLHSGEWDEDLCHLFGVPVKSLPRIVPTTGDFGYIHSKGRNLPVTASIVDQQAALYGHNCNQAGDTKITFGTGAFALTITGDKPCQSAGQGLLPTVAWQLEDEKPVYALDGGVYSAGSAINWAKGLGLFENYTQLQNFGPESAFKKDLVFIPALTGLGCPYWDRTAGGTWLGLALDTKPADLLQSILEGIVLRTAEVIEAMDKFSPIKETISIDGGLSANTYLCQFLADVLGRQIIVQSSPDLTALGVAKLAAGEDNQKSPGDESTRHYFPETDRRSYLVKFKDAVTRSAQWRS